MERPRRHGLAIELTSHCNQRCSYCYNDWRADNGKRVGALEPATLCRVLERAFEEVEFEQVTLTGGEPTAYPGFFDVLALCDARGLVVQIISNGALIDDALAARIAEHGVASIQVSLNGPDAELHAEHIGADLFEDTIEGIRALLRHGVHVDGCIVVTRKNAHLVGEILDTFLELSVRSVALSRFSPAGFAAEHAAALLPSRSELIVALEQGEIRGREQGMDLQVTMPVPECVVEHAEYPHIQFGGCPIGTQMQEFVLGPQGELRSCTLHTEVLGNAKSSSMAELVVHSSVTAYRDTTPEFCAPCPHRSHCLGGCGAAAGTMFGDARGLDPFVAQHVDEAFSKRLEHERERRVRLPIAGIPVK